MGVSKALNQLEEYRRIINFIFALKLKCCTAYLSEWRILKIIKNFQTECKY